MGGALLGFPVRPVRARVREGIASARGFGIELRYELGGPASPSELGSHELGLFQAAGLRELRVRRGEASWQQAEPVGAVRADPLLALGFAVDGPPELRYAAAASFEAELPPQARLARAQAGGWAPRRPGGRGATPRRSRAARSSSRPR